MLANQTAVLAVLWSRWNASLAEALQGLQSLCYYSWRALDIAVHPLFILINILLWWPDLLAGFAKDVSILQIQTSSPNSICVALSLHSSCTRTNLMIAAKLSYWKILAGSNCLQSHDKLNRTLQTSELLIKQSVELAIPTAARFTLEIFNYKLCCL